MLNTSNETMVETTPVWRRKRYLIAVLVFLMGMVNYIDRQALSTAAPVLAKTFHIQAGLMGLILSCFFWSYIVLVIPFGYLTDRFGTKLVTTISIIVWSATSMLTGLVNSAAMLFGLRLMLGASESPSFPTGNKVGREWAPEKDRGLFAAAMNTGTLFGPAVGALLTAFLITRMGWRASFFVTGSLGFVWVIIWILAYRKPEHTKWLSEEEREYIVNSREADTAQVGQQVVKMSTWSLLRQPSIWGLMLGQGCAVYTIYFYLTWLPSYLVQARHVELLDSGLLSAIPFAVATVMVLIFSQWSNRFVPQHKVKTGGRRWVIIVFFALSSVLVVAPLIKNLVWLEVLLTWSFTMITTGQTLMFALTSDLIVDESSAGRAFAMLVLGGNSFGLVAPIVTGFIVQSTGSFNTVFIFGLILLIIGIFIVAFFTNKPLQPHTPETIQQGAIGSEVTEGVRS
jgi:ACS family glucarate transporter-like MFS transporter